MPRRAEKPRLIHHGAIRVGDRIEVTWESHGVTNCTRAYVGVLRRTGRTTTDVLAANERTRLLSFAGALITHPSPNAQIWLLRAAPDNPGVGGLFDA